jgi:hypothetical protein
MKLIFGTFVAVGAAVVLSVIAVSNVGAQSKTKVFDLETTKAHEVKFPKPLSLASPIKLCSAVNDPYWRDTISVPDSFTPEACKGYASSVGAWHYQLACLAKDSVSWGALQGGTPSTNSCNW